MDRFIMRSLLLPPMEWKVLSPTALKIPGKGVPKPDSFDHENPGTLFLHS